MIEIDFSSLAFFIVCMSAALAISVWFPFAFSIMIIALNEHLFGMMPFKFAGYDLVRGLAGPVLIFMAIFIQMMFRFGEFRHGLKHGTTGSYFPYVLTILGIVVFSTLWGGVYIFDQNLRSLIFQPIVFLYYFLYVYLCFFSPDKRQIRSFLGIMVMAALLIGILMVIDSAIIHEARILKYANISERVGIIRIVVFVTGIAWAYYYALACADEEKFSPLRKLLFAGISLFLLTVVVFIQIDRQTMMATVLTTVVVAFSMKTYKKLIVVWVMALFLLIVIADPDFSFDKTLPGRLLQITTAEVKTKESGIGIRLKAMEFYYEHYKKTYGLGFGVLGSRREYRNPVSEGIAEGYNLNDLSLSGIIFRFGIPGMVLIIAVAWKLFRDTGRILRTRDPVIRSMARGIRYTVLHLVIIFPLTTFLFYPEKTVYFAVIFFIVERLASIVSMETAEVNSG